MDPKPNESISEYATFGNNPIFHIDIKGDSVDYSNLYKKDNGGNLLYKEKVLAFELFASTDEGKKGILLYAEKGFKLKGELIKDLNIEATSEGERSKQGVDVKFTINNTTKAASGWTSPFIKKNQRLLLQINNIGDISVKDKGFRIKILNEIDTYSHELFLHGDLSSRRYFKLKKNKPLLQYSDRTELQDSDHDDNFFDKSQYSRIGLEILTQADGIMIRKKMTSGSSIGINPYYLYYNIMLPGIGKDYINEIQP